MKQYPKLIRELTKWDGHFEAFKLPAENCDVLFASYHEGEKIEPHHHDTENVGIITEGELILTLNGQEERFKVGEWYHIPTFAEHAARTESDTRVIEFWFKKS